ncbi:tetratricopeptide repeat protein [Opitutus sp. ER46]|uniref:O-linked N-acetylglucosamine transferase, SPINDLY family protein n=1 Tax=Opitutus sp. ER46 TaxID=2161864 RepID=UPI000D319263|nr:tetratricopeptide repeat protein [Opitutus sp. ER46]PTX90870.1 hypothetical protein DB354_19660 [Opitutus sp. ER46]
MAANPQLTHRLNEAIAHHKAGRLERAESIYRQVAAQAPGAALVYDLWGQLAEQQGRSEDAMRLYQQAFRLDGRSAGAATRIAAVYIAQGRLPDAEKILRRLLQAAPDSADGWNVLGFALKLQGRFPDAIACHQKAVTLNPKFVEGWTHFGLTCGLMGRNHEALVRFDRALALRPDYAPARYGRAQSLHKTYRMEAAIAEYDAYLKVEPRNAEAYSYRLFALQNLEGITRQQLFEEHRRYGRLVGTGPRSLPGYDVSPDRRLRLAILSPDLRTHSCAYFLEPLLQQLDPAQFELYLYHDHFSEDDMSARLKKHATVWRNFMGQPHAAVEKVIRADRPDVLVDLAGHIGNMIRLPIFAKRLAPVQITYLGYPDSTGVPAMDYRFTDPVADPEGEADAFATEKLVRFAPTAWTYQPPVEAGPVAPLPMTVGAPVTFGCFNSPTKFTSGLFRAWARILERVPGSRLLLKGRDLEEPQVKEHMNAWMTECGLPLDRIELLPRTAGAAEHLALYSRMDIALDTFPYNGTTTTCEALWMGRPVVAVQGSRHAARVSASLLSAVGHPDWVAPDVEGYVDLAVRLAAQPAEAVAASAGLRADLQRSPLLDHVGQGKRFAAALRACWIERGKSQRAS